MARLTERFAHVLAVDAAELAQQFLRSLVEQLRQHQLHLDDEVAAAPVASRGDATLAQPEALARLRPGRDPHFRPAIGRWHVDARTERRLVDGDRDREV